MAKSILTRYLDPVVLSRISKHRIEPRDLVIGNLAGAHRSPLAGFAVEFAGHREYVWGDDPKHIDWRVYFTRERYVIKQYEMETNFVCHLDSRCQFLDALRRRDRSRSSITPPAWPPRWRMP